MEFIDTLIKELGLEDTKEYKYRIKENDAFRGYIIERYNKANGCLCSLAVSSTMLDNLQSGLVKDFASLLHREFNSAEAKATSKVYRLNLSEIKHKVQGKSQLLDAMLSDPKFVEISKIMGCHNQNVPARINGEVKKITCYNYEYDFNASAIRFNYDVSDWEGQYDMIIDIDLELLK